MKIIVISVILAIEAIQSSTQADSEPEKKACLLPLSPTNGQYNVNQLENPDPAKAYEFLALNYSCSPGYETFGNRVRLCIKGTWSSDEPKCVRVCKLFKDPSVKYNCAKGLDIRPCDDSEPEGTLIRPKCSENYYFPGDLPNMRCINERWDHYPTCQPDCGIFPTDELAVKPFFTPAGLIRVPWFATVYKKYLDKPYLGWCLATLISKNIILTGAHCFWDSKNKKKLPAKEFAVAVGKIIFGWNATEDTNVQKSDVADIIIHPEYPLTVTNDMQNNIAAVKLATEVTFGPDVRPVCLDFDLTFEQQQLQKMALGLLPLWLAEMKNETRVRSLTVYELPYVPRQECITRFKGDFKKYVSFDKICAGTSTGTVGRCQVDYIGIGNSGGGITYPEQQRGVTRYYLRGIATLTSRTKICPYETIAVFTQISKHENFIREFI